MRNVGIVSPVAVAALIALAAARSAPGDPPAAPWVDRDIGSPSLAGSTDVNAAGGWTIRGSSRSLGIKADHLHFASQLVRGDASITAHGAGIVGGHGVWARVGLMLRVSETPGAPNVFLAMTPGQGLIATSRLVQDGESGYLGPVGPSSNRPTDLHLRLQRSGNEIAGFYSRDGILWFQAGFPPQTLAALSDAVHLGLAVTSQQEGALTTGTFSSVSLVSGATSVYGITGSGGDRSVLLQWRRLKNATGYTIYRGPSGATPDMLVPLNGTPIVETSFTDNSAGLVNGIGQTYAVAAVFRGRDGAPVQGPHVAITATPVAVPTGFHGCSINEGARSGSADFDASTGTITLRGSGLMTFDNADGLYFLNQSVTGDAQATVRVLTPPSNASNWAVAGLMIRESLDGSSRYATVWTTGARTSETWPRLLSQWRGVTNGFADWPGFFAIDNGALKPPVTLRLTRLGSTVTPEYSTDRGTTFRAAGPPVAFDPPLAKTVHIGLAVSSSAHGSITTARFSGLEIR
jgi:regulation of enolase protein 1 (concanavalin A-like superfamily)